MLKNVFPILCMYVRSYPAAIVCEQTHPETMLVGE